MQTTDQALILAQPGSAARQLSRGFSNAELAGALGLLAVIAVLLSLQSCPISFGGGKAGSKLAAGTAGQALGTAPPLIPSPADPLKAAAQRWVDGRQRDVKSFSTATTELQQSLGWMEPRAAAKLLEQLNPPEAASLLTRLRRRQIALILEQADPPTAAQWVQELLGQPAMPAIPDEFKPAAARAGLYDDSMDALQKYRDTQAQSSAAETGGAAGTAAPPPAGGQAGAATTPPAAGAAASPQPGTATPPAGGTPASGQAGQSGAAAGSAAAGGTAAPAGTAPPATGNQTPAVPGGAAAPPGTPAAGP